MPTRVFPSFDTIMAGFPPISKAEGLPSAEPLIVTSVPTLPETGVIELIIGGVGGGGAVKTHTAPLLALSTGPPIKAVSPSALRDTA
jgi:hypothetical protein